MLERSAFMSDDAHAPLSVQALFDHVHAALIAAARTLGAPEDLHLPIGKARNPDHGDVALPCFELRGRLTALDDAARNNPARIAQALAQELAADHVIAKAAPAGPYLNVTLQTTPLIQASLSEVFSKGERFGGDQIADPKHIVIEFSAPNTNKPQHLGHVRNNLLGEAVSAILAFAGHKVTKVNLINDRGIHICKSMLAYQIWGEDVTPETAGAPGALFDTMVEHHIWTRDQFHAGPGYKGDHLVGDFYVLFGHTFKAEYVAWQSTEEGQTQFQAWLPTEEGQKAVKAREGSEKAIAAWEQAQHAPAEETRGKKKKKKKKKPKLAPVPEAAFFKGFEDTYFNTFSALGKRTSAMLVAWEEGDEEVLALWRKLNGWVFDGFDVTYERLGVHFDKTFYESNTYKLGKEIVAEGLTSELFYTREDDAVVFDLSRIGKEGEKVLLRSNGTSVYMTQDLGTAVERYNAYHFDRMVYVVGDEQAYHFEVLFGILAHLRSELRDACHHLSYGMVNLPSGRMKTREGTKVDADKLMDDMRADVKHHIMSKENSEHYEGISEEEKSLRAERLGLASLKYFILDVTPRSSMIFDPTKSIDLQGRTGVYNMLSYARTRSILRKSGDQPTFSPDAVAPLSSSLERGLALQLAEWPRAVEWAVSGHDPAKITEYVFNLSKQLATLFSDRQGHPVISCPDPALRTARLLLIDAVGRVIKLGLSLIGVETLEEM